MDEPLDSRTQRGVRLACWSVGFAGRLALLAGWLFWSVDVVRRLALLAGWLGSEQDGDASPKAPLTRAEAANARYS